MGESNPEQLKKDWIVALTSTSGIMLTVCLMVLAIIYTTQSNQVHELPKAIVSFFILAASVYLVLCTKTSFDALGTLIFTSTYRSRGEDEKAEEFERKTADIAKKSQKYFMTGVVLLVIAIALTFIFLSGSTISSLLAQTVTTRPSQ